MLNNIYDTENPFSLIDETFYQIDKLRQKAIWNGDEDLVEHLDNALDTLDKASSDLYYKYKEEEVPLTQTFNRDNELEFYRDCKWDLYGQLINGYYTNIFHTVNQVKVCGSKGDTEKLRFKLHKVQYPRKKKDGYWGWIDTDNEKLGSVWREKSQTLLCLKNMDHIALEKDGHGLLVRLTVESLGKLKPKKPRQKKVIVTEPVKPISLPLRKIVWDD